MAFKVVDCDNVRETFTGAASTTITLGGAAQNSRALSAVLTSGDTFWGTARGGAEISVGLFTYNGSTVAQTSVFYSSNSNNAVSFSSGAPCEIFIDVPGRIFDELNLTEISVASASTCDIGAAQGGKIAITGTTTITSFGTSANKRRFVRFAGALTLTHNGTSLILPGAANITTVADDTAIFMSDASGNWRCYAYMRSGVGPFDRRSPGAIGGTTPAAGAFTTLSASGVLTITDATDAGSGTGSVVTSGGIAAAKAVRAANFTTGTAGQVTPGVAAFNSGTNNNNIGFGDAANAGDSHLGHQPTNATPGLVFHGRFGTTTKFTTGATFPASIFQADDAGGFIYRTLAAAQTNGTATDIMYLTAAGAVQWPLLGTTASAANAFLNSGAGNSLLRSTSSLRYKKDAEDIWDEVADSVLQLRPIWYRSKAEADNPDWSWYGLAAEEVAAVDPRLVHWTYPEEAYEIVETIEEQDVPVLEEVDVESTRITIEDGRAIARPVRVKIERQKIELMPVYQDDGNPLMVAGPDGQLVQATYEHRVTRRERVVTKTERRLKADARMVPDGVMYERVAVLLLGYVQRRLGPPAA